MGAKVGSCSTIAAQCSAERLRGVVEASSAVNLGADTLRENHDGAIQIDKCLIDEMPSVEPPTAIKTEARGSRHLGACSFFTRCLIDGLMLAAEGCNRRIEIRHRRDARDYEAVMA